MERFYVISMKIKDKYKVYLGEGKGLSMIWTDVNKAVWFETKQEAEKFADSYFLTFKDYSVDLLEYNMQTEAIETY